MDNAPLLNKAILLILMLVCLPALAATAAQKAAQDTVSSPHSEWTVQRVDEYVYAVFTEEREDEYERAAELYLQMVFAAADQELGPVEQGIIDRHIFDLNLIVPREKMSRVCANLPDPPRAHYGEFQVHTPLFSCDFTNETRGILMRWWRSQNPLPATTHNERLEEHLKRVAYARAHYRSDRRPGGLDDRGLVYIRYGEPDRYIRVRPGHDSAVMRMLNSAPSITTADFPRGEFWVYGRISRDAHYLFVEERNEFRFAAANDFVPRRLTGRYALIYLSALRVALRDLSLYHIDYATRYNELDDWLMSYGMGTRPRLDAQGMATVITSRNETEDRHIDARRAELPQESSDVLRTYEPLHVQVRTARFLDEDGNTRIEMYWSHPPDPFRLNRRERRWLRRELGDPEIDGYVISLATSISSGDYAHRHLDYHQYRLSRENAESGFPAQVQTVSLDAVYSEFHFGAQWDGYFVFETEDDDLEIGPQIKQITLRRDTVRALDPSGSRIEMSDLKPLFAERGRIFVDEAGSPYPFQGISPSVAVALYFELYHLTPDEEGLSRYTVSYDIIRQRDPEGLLRLRTFDAESVSAEYEVTAEGPRSDEHIELDLSEWEGSGTLTVQVTVKDNHSGESVRRSIDFSFVEQEEALHFTRNLEVEEAEGDP